MAASDTPIEWTVAGVLDEIGKLHSSMPDRALAFVLGSGASVTSGIPTGKTMAENWLNELHLRECHDGVGREEWIASGKTGIDGLMWDSSAEFYPQIFERRFRGDPESGFASLESAMDGKEPSLGYSLLAEIMQHTRHKVVVTTNFDNLVADALAIHAHKPPLIVGHESLTGYVRPLSGRPLVAKIHRDLFLHPKNDQAGVSTLDKGWHDALTRLFKHYMPIVIGYGGNDGSLMGFLENLKPTDINGRIYWCFRAGSPPSQKVRDLLLKLNGVMVAIPGFDEFMLQMAAKLIADFDMAAISNRIEERGKNRAASYRKQAEDLQKALVAAVTPSENVQATRQVLTDAFRDSTNWWSWEMRANEELDPEKRDRIYQAGLAAVPPSAELSGNYATFLYQVRKDISAADAMYKKAMELDPRNAINAGNYANFLSSTGKDADVAEAMHQRALDIDPRNALNIVNYALFLHTVRKDYDKSEARYREALGLDPNSGIIMALYARFLMEIRKDYDAAEGLYRRALELNPLNSFVVGSYASFLHTVRRDYTAAEGLYREALARDPNNAVAAGDYASMLHAIIRDYDAAEMMYKKALQLDPRNAISLGNYANFLSEVRQNFNGADDAYKRALELDAGNAIIAGNYANFLQLVRKDFDAAEATFKKALELDPTNAVVTGNFANLLHLIRGDYQSAETTYKKALELDPKAINNVVNWAGFQLLLGRLDGARQSAQDVIRMSGGTPAQATAEALLYLALIDVLGGANMSSELGRLKSLFRAGYSRVFWSFDRLFAATLPKLQADVRSLFEALGAAVLDASKTGDLELNKLWQQIEERPWFDG
jgi:Tfp pilus assembly protein PilF